MRASEYRDMPDVQLTNELDDCYREMFNLRFQKETRQLSNYRRIPAVRRDIARIKTIQRERQIAAAYAQFAESTAD